MSSQVNSLGFKKLNKDNWKALDPLNDYFIKLNFHTGEKRKVTEDERAEEFLKIELIMSVPIEVQRQFETARGAMLYGCFFYPLFALGIDQLFRVAESAITYKCLALNLTKDTDRFVDKLKKLKKYNHFTQEEYVAWDLLRKMRNEFSHSKIQSLYPPFEAVFLLKNITNKINKLFEPK